MAKFFFHQDLLKYFHTVSNASFPVTVRLLRLTASHAIIIAIKIFPHDPAKKFRADSKKNYFEQSPVKIFPGRVRCKKFPQDLTTALPQRHTRRLPPYAGPVPRNTHLPS
jgi:hypothetical protein